eukprot:g5411.t1
MRQVFTIFPVLFQGASVSGEALLVFKHRYHSRVWPGDLDIFCHKNNIKYVERCEIGRIALLRDVGLLRYMRNNKIFAGFSSISLRFRRELSLFQPFTIETTISGWDERSWYIDQKFISRDGFVHCHCHSILKLGSRGKSSKTSPSKILGKLSGVDKLEAINMDEGLELLSKVYEFSSKELRKNK